MFVKGSFQPPDALILSVQFSTPFIQYICFYKYFREVIIIHFWSNGYLYSVTKTYFDGLTDGRTQKATRLVYNVIDLGKKYEKSTF